MQINILEKPPLLKEIEEERKKNNIRKKFFKILFLFTLLLSILGLTLSLFSIIKPNYSLIYLFTLTATMSLVFLISESESTGNISKDLAFSDKKSCNDILKYITKDEINSYYKIVVFEQNRKFINIEVKAMKNRYEQLLEEEACRKLYNNK